MANKNIFQNVISKEKQARDLIELLTEESLNVIIQLMCILPKKTGATSDKLSAYERMESLRTISKKYNLGSLEEERSKAIEEKYGRI